MTDPSTEPLAGPDDPRVRHESIETNGVVLHVAQAGPDEGPLVLLLHGFPAFWYDWRHQIPALAAAGFRVWAPDQRGYNSSDKPAGVRSYNLNTLADDVAGLIDAAGVERAFVVGHDWGAAVAWWVAQRHVNRVRRLTILNVPAPHVLVSRLLSDLRQVRRSSYAFFFQLHFLPEAVLGMGDWHRLGESIKRTARRGTFTDDILDA
jgi:pimeloyl-ACP methyl ester carboxylesterase